MSRPSLPRLLGDVGGTNARFALQDAAGSALRNVVTLPCADFASLADALKHYLRQTAEAPPAQCAIGIANPVVGDRVQMTNHHWSFSIEALRQEIGFDRLVVINDFTALALALPDLADDELRQCGGRNAVAGAAKALIGPGTGLGVSGLLPGAAAGQWVPLQGEGGHVTVAATNLREFQVLQWLRDRHGHASAERAVSGQGLEALFEAVCAVDGITAITLPTAAEISARALSASDAQSIEALDLFCSFLGNVAGNLALTLGARGGVYVGGGIVPKLGEAFSRSRFRECFEAKGRFSAYLADIPVYVIHAKVSPALLGAARSL